jgi:hypothetical protein
MYTCATKWHGNVTQLLDLRDKALWSLMKAVFSVTSLTGYDVNLLMRDESL